MITKGVSRSLAIVEVRGGEVEASRERHALSPPVIHLRIDSAIISPTIMSNLQHLPLCITDIMPASGGRVAFGIDQVDADAARSEPIVGNCLVSTILRPKINNAWPPTRFCSAN